MLKSFHFFLDLAGFGEPSWEGKSTQDRSKINPEGHQKNNRKKGPLGSVLEAFFCSKIHGRRWLRPRWRVRRDPSLGFFRISSDVIKYI